MRINEWPDADRPREKLLTKGVNGLTDAELLAIILTTGTRGKTALDIAKTLLASFGSIKALVKAPKAKLLKEKGLGVAKYTRLVASFELGKRYQAMPVAKMAVMNNSEHSARYLTARLQDRENEVFACLFLDNRLRLIACEELSQGTVNEACVYPRELIKRSLAHNAVKVILAHNHPSGNAIPSCADRELTRVLQQALALIGVEVLDHIVIGNPDHFSFNDHGLL